MSRFFVITIMIISTFCAASPSQAGRGKNKDDKGSVTKKWAQKIGKNNNDFTDNPPKTKPQSKKHLEFTFYQIKSPTLRFIAFWGTLFATVKFAHAMTCEGNTCIDNPHNLPTNCNPQPRHTNVKQFPPIFHNVPHPGTVSAPTKIKNRGEVQKRLLAIQNKAIADGILKGTEKPAEANKKVGPYLDALYRTCEIDAKKGNDDPVDRTNFSHGIKRFETLVMQKGFKGMTASELTEAYSQVHHTLTTGEPEGTSEYRNGPMIIQTSSVRLFYPDEVRDALIESATPREDLVAYTALFQELIDYNVPTELLQKRDTWQELAFNILLYNPNHPSYAFLKKHFTVKPRIDPKKFRDVLKTTFAKAKQKMEKDPIDAAAYLHMRLIDIHGYGDGNGRDARLFAFGLLAEAGYTPPIVLHNKRYTAAILKSYQKTDHRIFADYLRGVISETEAFESAEQKKNWKFLLDDLSKCEPGDCEEGCTANLKNLGIERDLSGE